MIEQATELVGSAFDKELDDLLRFEEGVDVCRQLARFIEAEMLEVSPDLMVAARRAVWRPLAQGAVVRLLRALLDGGTDSPLGLAEADLVELFGDKAREEYARRTGLSVADADRAIRVAARTLLESDLFAEGVTLARRGKLFAVVRRAARLAAVPLDD